jgi:carboxymethylenebutenolidase
VDDRSPADLTAAEQAMLATWQQHVLAEFVRKDVEGALATMTDDPYVVNYPVLIGGDGKDGVRSFYTNYFIPQMPPDIAPTMASQTVGQERIVEEAVYTFTHSLAMDWLLPGVPPTGKRVELPVIAIIQFREGKIAHEHLHWDQATVLAQLGLIDASTLPVVGVQSARRLLDTRVPLNALLQRAGRQP